MTSTASHINATGAPVSKAVLRWMNRNRNIFLSFLVFLLVWEFASRLFDIPVYLLPAPSVVMVGLYQNLGPIMQHAIYTGYVIILGYIICVAVSVPLALLFALSRTLQTTVYPLLVLFKIIPKIALAPLFIIWFGFGVAPKLLFVFLLSFFPIIVSSIAGFRSTSPEILDFARSTGAGEWDVFRKIRLPAALPDIFIGLKVAAVMAPTAAVVSEFVSSDRGLGFLLLRYNGNLETAMAFATIFVLSVLGLLLYYGIELLERLTIPWHVSHDDERGQVATTGAG